MPDTLKVTPQDEDTKRTALMSCYEGERGTYTLATAEVPKLHKALRNYANDFHAKLRPRSSTCISSLEALGR